MHALTLYFIMKLGAISMVLFWGSFLYLGYLFYEYACIWWNLPVDGDSGWCAFWHGKRKKATVAAVAMIVAMALPSTKEAVVMTVVPSVVQSSIWERLFNNGMNWDMIARDRQLSYDNAK